MRLVVMLVTSALWFAPESALAQRATFQRTFDASTAVTLDVVTAAGRIGVTPGPAGRVIVLGTVTVRNSVNVPANAGELVARVAASPPVQQTGDRIELQLPNNAVEQRAVTIEYEISVPPGTRVHTRSESGAVSVVGNSGTVSVETQSGAITLKQIEADVTIASGSGAVSVAAVMGSTTVTTQSSAITLQEIGGAVHVRTQSGAAIVGVAAGVDVDVQTGSSAIAVTGDAGTVRATSNSGRIRVNGQPRGDWTVESGSGRVELTLSRGASARLDLSTRSGTITIPSGLNTSVLTKQRVVGTLGSADTAVVATVGSGGVLLRSGD
jgi:hypothetical protein